MLLLGTVDAHRALTQVELGLQGRDGALQFFCGFPQVVAVQLGLLSAVLVVLLGEPEHLLELVDGVLHVEFEEADLGFAKLGPEEVGEPA